MRHLGYFYLPVHPTSSSWSRFQQLQNKSHLHQMRSSSALSGPCCDKWHSPGTQKHFQDVSRVGCLLHNITEDNKFDKKRRRNNSYAKSCHESFTKWNLLSSFQIILEVASEVLFASPQLIWKADAATASSINPHPI